METLLAKVSVSKVQNILSHDLHI